MITLARLPFLQRDNPIEQAELEYQKRSGRWLSGLVFWLMVVALLAATVCVLVYTITTVLSLSPNLRAAAVQNALPIFLTLTIPAHLLVVILTLSFSANAVVREKEARRWNMLILTQVSARQIIIGKWWASVRFVRVSVPFLWGLRAALIVLFWTLAFFDQRDMLVDYLPHLGFALFAALIDVLLTISLAAALGVFVSTFAPNRSAALVLAFCLYIAIALALLGTAYNALRYIHDPLLSVNYSEWARFARPEGMLVGRVFSLFDGGITQSFSILWSEYSSINYTQAMFVPLVIITVWFSIAVWLLLRAAEAVIVHQSALAPKSA